MVGQPTLSELYTGILSNLEAEFGVNISSFGKVFLRVWAAVQAGLLKMLYLAMGKVQKNIFADSADPESMGGTLERFGRVKLNRDPFPATAGQYVVEITGEVGATVPALTTFKSNDSAFSPGKLFILDLAYTLVSSPDTITLRALEAGNDSALVIGDSLTATAPLLDVNQGAVVSSEAVEPLAAETIEEYRTKVVNAYRTETQGGSGGDYREWSADAQGVQQVYPYAESGEPFGINLYVEATIADSTDGKGTPSAGLLADVEDVVNFDPDTTKPINKRSRRPIQAIVDYLPITPLDVDINIAGSVGLTPAKEATLLEAITDKLAEIRPFVSAADVLADKNSIVSINNIIGWILEALPGSIFGAVTLTVDGVDYTSYEFEAGNIPYLNSLTFV